MSLKIMIVDDDASLRQMLDVTLGLDDRIAEVESTGTPDEALKLAVEFEPDVVVVDSVLVADGSEVGEHLREVLPDARLISFSGMEREALWADARVLKSGDGIEQLRREIFRMTQESEVEGSAAGDDDDELRRFIHDIRNPIGAIIGFTHILRTRNDKLTEKQHIEVIEALDRTAERLSGLVEAFAEARRSQSE